MLQTVRVEKVDEKNGVICLVSMVLKFSKKIRNFSEFCVDVNKKTKYVKVIYIYIYIYIKSTSHFLQVV